MKHAVRVIPLLLGPAANGRMLDGYRASLLIRACDDHDTGYLPEDQVIDALCSLGKHRKTAESLVRKAIAGGFVERKIRHWDRRRMLKILGYGTLLDRFGVKKGCQLIEVPTELVASRAWVRALAAAAAVHIAREPSDEKQRPISRAGITAVFGISAQTQRRAERIAQVKAVPGWKVEPLQPVQRVDQPGTKTDGKYLYTRLPNAYWRNSWSPVRVTSRRAVPSDSCKYQVREHRSRTVARDRAAELKPQYRTWFPPIPATRGGNTRLYPLAVKHGIILFSSVDMLPEDWQATGDDLWPRGKTHGRSWDQ